MLRGAEHRRQINWVILLNTCEDLLAALKSDVFRVIFATLISVVLNDKNECTGEVQKLCHAN